MKQQLEQQSVVHSTFVLERNYPKSPERVFSAFSKAPLKRRWFLESDKQDVEHFEMDFRVGGTEQARLRLKEGTPFPGIAIVTETTYLDIQPDRRIVIASIMTLGEKPVSASLVTFEFSPAENGTDLICTYQGAFFEGSDGPERREGGWRKLLDKLEEELSRS
jgi:uncharacterized protein YndB with AHSA1/START domain